MSEDQNYNEALTFASLTVRSKIEEAQIFEQKAEYPLALKLYHRLLEDKNLDENTRNEIKVLTGVAMEKHYIKNPELRKIGIQYVREAAQAGNHRAIKELARYFKNGLEGVIEKSSGEQKIWEDRERKNHKNYEKLVKDGREHYDQGNYQEAARFFIDAAKHGSSEALVRLGLMHQNGQGFEKDLSKSVEYYQEAMKQDYPPAKYYLGIHYLDSNDRSFANLEKAFVLIKSASQEKVIEAVNLLGEIYENGLIASNKVKPLVEKNTQEAFKHYEEAYKLGSEDALRNLARCYQKGIGTAPDLDKARELAQPY